MKKNLPGLNNDSSGVNKTNIWNLQPLKGEVDVITILFRLFVVSFLVTFALFIIVISFTLALGPRQAEIGIVPQNKVGSQVLGATDDASTNNESFFAGVVRVIFSPLGKFNQWLIKTSDKNATQIVDPLTTKELNEIFEEDDQGNIIVKKKLILLESPALESFAPINWDEIKGIPSFLSSINNVQGVAGNIKLLEGDNITITNDKSKNTITISSTGTATVTGDVTVNLTAGTGISISNDIISNTNLGSSQSIFKKVGVSGQSTVTADSNNDTLTFAAGAGIALTTSASTDSVTIAATGAAVSVPFSGVTAGTNANALVIGTGGSLTISGSGTITATNLVAGSSVVSDAEVDNNITVASAGITGTLTDAQVSNTLTIDGTGSVTFGALASYPAACSAGDAITALADSPTCSTFWYSGNDGAGSGLDADLFDGSDSTAFSPVTGSGSITTVGALTSGSIASGFGTISTANSISGTILTATTAASGLVLGTGVNATTLSSGATAARAISFPDEAGTICTTGSICTGYQASGSYVLTTRTLTAGNGLSGGGDLSADRTFDLGALTANWDQTGAFDISLNNASSELRILESAGATFFGTLDVGDLSADSTYTLSGASGTIWTSGNDGAGSTLDADLLDTIGSLSFLRSDTSDAFTSGTLTIGPGTLAITGTDGTDDDYIYFDTGTSEFIAWDDAPGEFDFSDDVNISGSLTASVASTISSTSNPGLTVGDGATGYLKVGGSTISDAAGDLTLDSDSGVINFSDRLAFTAGFSVTTNGQAFFTIAPGSNTNLVVPNVAGDVVYGMDMRPWIGPATASGADHGSIVLNNARADWTSSISGATVALVSNFQTEFIDTVVASSTTLTNYKAINIKDPVLNDPDFTITNLYGIYIEDFSADGAIFTNTPYAIYQAGADDINFFGGGLIIGAATNTASPVWTVENSTAGTFVTTSAIDGVGYLGYIDNNPMAVYNGELYFGTQEPAKAEVYKYDGTTFTLVTQSTAGTIASGGTASIDGVVSMTVYNGSLYVGTVKSNAAEIYRYDGGTTWTKVSQSTAGTIASGGTASIDRLLTLAVYNGELYAGTFESNAAEIYRYDGGTTWTKVSQSTAGTIASGGTASIDNVQTMSAYNGSLYVGTGEAGAGEIYRYDGGTTWTKVSNSTAGTVASGGTSAIDRIIKMTVYNGSLYVGTLEGAKGEVYRYDGTGTDWTKVSQSTAGTIASGGTTSIDGIGSMSVYNGVLYVGTSENTGAEIYRYDGGTTWTKVSDATAGTILSGETTAIDRIPTMAVYKGSLYVGTYEGSVAELYKYTRVLDQSNNLTFQGTNSNEGSIFFATEEQVASSGGASTKGTFQFSNAISTNFGGYDLAEKFATTQNLSPGELVTVDPSNKEHVVRTTGEYDSSVIGVVSSNPGFVLNGEFEGKSVEVALVGRTPVNVSIENGDINPGDPLTSSSTAGVAMKATSSGPIVGKALEGYSDSGIGKIMVFVNTSWYVSPITDSSEQIANLTNLNVETLTAGTIQTDILFIGDRQLDMAPDGTLVVDGSVNILGDLTLEGDLKVAGEITTKKVNVSDEAAGSSTIETGKTKIFIETSLITDKSQVLITLNTLTQETIAVTEKNPDEGFTVEISSPETKDVNFDWFIVN